MSIAKEQYSQYLKNGVQSTPFYAVPYLDLVEWKGKEEADRILTYYQKGYFLTVPCVRDGVLLLSYQKYIKENEPTK